MFKTKRFAVLFIVCSFFCFNLECTAESASAKTAETLHIDIPVKLAQANVVFNIDHWALMGNKSIALGHLSLLANDFKASKTKGKIIAIFHTNAGYVTAGDKAYNAFLHVNSGNPYKQLFADLMKQGVQVELCGATAKANHWVNTDLLPGVKVNTDAMIRLTQLVKKGYVPIKE
jgi:intracellular sulfur oxidation DsrE/DsrF family protein